jgi:GNAT superfamily N-acetyltransferase
LLSPPARLEDVASACDVSRFSCGEPDLDNWLKRWAPSSEGRSARTYVVRDDDRVIAYYCLATGGIERKQLPRKIRHGNPDLVPVFVLGRMAVDLEFQGRRLGRHLLGHCFLQCCAAAEIIGTRGLLVHPLNDQLVEFYRKAQFYEISGLPRAMLITTEAIQAAVAARPSHNLAAATGAAARTPTAAAARARSAAAGALRR